MKYNRNRILAGLLTSVLCIGLMTGCGLLSGAGNAALDNVSMLDSEEASQDTGESVESAGVQADDKGTSDAAQGGFAKVEKGSEESDTQVPADRDEDSLRFATVDLDGVPVTDGIFSDADITVVHVWGTFCGPCIAEMPSYGEFARNLPEKVNLIGIVTDVMEGDERGVVAAEDILQDAGAEFRNLCLNDTTYPMVADFQFVPSSFFVDSEGHVIGEVLDGAGFEDTMEELSNLMN